MTSRHWGAIFIEELLKGDWYHKTSQAFVVFLPVKFVGVVGDGRRYEYVVVLRGGNLGLYDCALGAPALRRVQQAACHY